MQNLWKGRPFAMKKMEQLWRLVRESHEQPMSGAARPVELVDDDELGVTFIGHSSFLLQVDGRKVLVDPVFSKRLVVLPRQRQPGRRGGGTASDRSDSADSRAHGPSGYGLPAARHSRYAQADRQNPGGRRAPRCRG